MGGGRGLGVRWGGGGAGTEGIIPVLGGGEGRGEGEVGWKGRGGGGRDRIKALYLSYNKQRRVSYTVTIAWHVTRNIYEVNDLHHNSSEAV